MPQLIQIDDQPISATFFGQGKWLTSFVTPEDLEVQELFHDLTQGLATTKDKITALWFWVASEVKYKKFISGSMNLEGKVSSQNDLWNDPGITKRIKIGNCANKAFLLASLIRNELPAQEVHCVLGNLYNGKPGGHAWVQVTLNGSDFIVEGTRADIPVLVPAESTQRYEAVHLFNDKVVYSIPDRAVMEPYTACYSTWLKDYLDWSYIHRHRGE